MSRNATPTRAMTDTRYGAGRQPQITVTCFGCPARLRRAARGAPAIALCADCKRTVERAYEAQIRADGITPSVMPGNQWGPAWAGLSLALRLGEREDRELIASLLTVPVAAA